MTDQDRLIAAIIDGSLNERERRLVSKLVATDPEFARALAYFQVGLTPV